MSHQGTLLREKTGARAECSLARSGKSFLHQGGPDRIGSHLGRSLTQAPETFEKQTLGEVAKTATKIRKNRLGGEFGRAIFFQMMS